MNSLILFLVVGALVYGACRLLTWLLVSFVNELRREREERINRAAATLATGIVNAIETLEFRVIIDEKTPPEKSR